MAKIVFKRENGADNNAPPGSHKQRRRRRRRSTKSNSSLPLLGISNPTLAAYALPNPNQRKDSSNRSMAKLRKSMESRAKVRKRRSRIKPQLNKVDTEDRRHAFGPSVAERQVEDLLQVMYERMDIHRQRRRRKRRARRTLHVRCRHFSLFAFCVVALTRALNCWDVCRFVKYSRLFAGISLANL